MERSFLLWSSPSISSQSNLIKKEAAVFSTAACFRKMEYLKRISKLILGLFICATGLYLSIRANIGLAPWDSLTVGIERITEISYGNVSVMIGIAVIVADIFLKEKIGIGTILNTILMGKFVDLLNYMDLIAYQENFLVGVLMLLIGQFILCIGCYFYMGAQLGCGPRDSFMVAFGKRLNNVPIGAVRFCIELTVLVIGWILGAKVGLGSVICMFGISIIMQFTFSLLHFDVKALQHEDIFDTLKRISSHKNEKNAVKI